MIICLNLLRETIVNFVNVFGKFVNVSFNTVVIFIDYLKSFENNAVLVVA